jgi:hypothetical protein
VAYQSLDKPFFQDDNGKWQATPADDEKKNKPIRITSDNLDLLARDGEVIHVVRASLRGRPLGYFDALSLKHTAHEFTVWLAPGDRISFHAMTLPASGPHRGEPEWHLAGPRGVAFDGGELCHQRRVRCLDPAGAAKIRHRSCHGVQHLSHHGHRCRQHGRLPWPRFVPGMIEWSREHWKARQAAHLDRVGDLADAFAQRRSHGTKHPVEDFLFTYYNLSPAKLKQRVPPLGVAIEASAEDLLECPWLASDRFVRQNDRVFLDEAFLTDHTRQLAKWIRDLCDRVSERPTRFRCFGLHEWAMVYRLPAEQIRHQGYELRLTPEELASFVDLRASNRLLRLHANLRLWSLSLLLLIDKLLVQLLRSFCFLLT